MTVRSYVIFNEILYFIFFWKEKFIIYLQYILLQL